MLVCDCYGDRFALFVGRTLVVLQQPPSRHSARSTADERRQLIFGIAIIGVCLTLNALSWDRRQSPGPAYTFATFAAAYGMGAAALGLVSFRFDWVHFYVLLAVDALGAMMYLGAGVGLVTKHCNSSDFTSTCARTHIAATLTWLCGGVQLIMIWIVWREKPGVSSVERARRVGIQTHSSSS